MTGSRNKNVLMVNVVKLIAHVADVRNLKLQRFKGDYGLIRLAQYVTVKSHSNGLYFIFILKSTCFVDNTFGNCFSGFIKFLVIVDCNLVLQVVLSSVQYVYRACMHLFPRTILLSITFSLLLGDVKVSI